MGQLSLLFEIQESESGKVKLVIKKPLEVSHLSMASLKEQLNDFLEFQEIRISVLRYIEKWKKIKIRTAQRFLTKIEEFECEFLTDVDKWTHLFILQTGIAKDSYNQQSNGFANNNNNNNLNKIIEEKEESQENFSTTETLVNYNKNKQITGEHNDPDQFIKDLRTDKNSKRPLT